MNWLKQVISLPFDRLSERRLSGQATAWHKPRHVGLILDGNRRFAREVGLPDVIDGHARGADKLHEALNWFYEFGIPVVTIWIFSLENFHREETEVSGLLGLIEQKTREMTTSEDVHRHQVRVRFIGRTHLLPKSLQEAMHEAESATRDYDRHTLNVAIAYGGRAEITDAIQRYCRDHANNGKPTEELIAELTPETLDEYMYTAELPDPDLIIRTSGEYRLSGFLLWQSAYAEYYFCNSFWPQFRRIDLLRALKAYDRRQRRFGR